MQVLPQRSPIHLHRPIPQVQLYAAVPVQSGALFG